jgi:hypothetical protein
VRALLDSLTGLDALTGGSGTVVRLTGARSWRSLPALYRDHAVFVTASAEQGREQVASGAHVIGPLGSGLDEATVRGELETARGARPLSLAEIRTRLRDIFLSHSTPARLVSLVQAAELPASLVSGRQVGVLVSVADEAQARRLAASLLAQRLRPTEVVAACAAGTGTAMRGALGALTDHGIRVAVTGTAQPGTGGSPPGTDWARPLARLASAGWLAPWAADGGQPDTCLLDLACARECAQADAVGLDFGKHGGAGDYEFTRWIDQPALVRAELLNPSGPAAADWGSHGLRLFTIAAERTAR